MPTATQKQQTASKTIMVAISELTESPWNPAIRTAKRHIARLADSMKRLGQLQPILITKGRQIIEGHRRVASAYLLGWDMIEAKVVAGKAEDIYADINTTQRQLNSKECLGIWLQNKNAVPKKFARKIEKAVADVGIVIVRQIWQAGNSIRVYQVATMIANFCGQNSTEFRKLAIAWVLRFGKSGNVSHVRAAIARGEGRAAIERAIRQNKEVKIILE